MVFSTLDLYQVISLMKRVYLEEIMTVAIIGAGIGGLSLGLCLHKLNIPFQIYEAVKELKPLGVGINIQPHAVRELFALGLKKDMDSLGICSEEVAYYSKQGDLIWTEPRGIGAGYRWPQYSVNRGDLQMLLYREITRRAGPNVIKTNTSLTNWHEKPTQIEMEFIDRKSGKFGFKEVPISNSPYERGNIKMLLKL